MKKFFKSIREVIDDALHYGLTLPIICIGWCLISALNWVLLKLDE